MGRPLNSGLVQSKAISGMGSLASTNLCADCGRSLARAGPWTRASCMGSMRRALEAVYVLCGSSICGVELESLQASITDFYYYYYGLSPLGKQLHSSSSAAIRFWPAVARRGAWAMRLLGYLETWDVSSPCMARCVRTAPRRTLHSSST